MLELPPNLVVAQVACGYQHSVLISAVHGHIYTFGANARGECGLGHLDPVVPRPSLVNLDNGPALSASTKGGHTIVMRGDGLLFGWGSNDSGQLGLGHSQTSVSTPTEIALLRNHTLTLVVCGCFHTVCCASSGQTFVFGDNAVGQLGLGDSAPESVLFPTPVPGLDGRKVESLACGFAHTVVILEEQDVVLAFGSNEHGQLGLGHSEDVARPTRVEAACHHGAAGVVCGYNTTFFWLDEGLFACGTNARGELGLGASMGDQWLPTKVVSVAHGEDSCLFASNFAVLVPNAPGNAVGGKARAQRGLASSSSFCDDLSAVLASHMMSDVDLLAGADGGVFQAHRCILQARCSRLAQVLETADPSRPVLLPRLSSNTVRRMLKYLYTGAAYVDEASLTDLLWLASASDAYQLLRLLCICEDEVRELLDDDNIILVLSEACKLKLATIKRICLEYVRVHYSPAVSARNRTVVDALGNAPELLAEVVGLSSPDFADITINALPSPAPCPAPSLDLDLESLVESGAHSDVVLVADDGSGESVGFQVHRVMLAARCPFFSSAFLAQHALKEDGQGAPVSQDDRRKVALVFAGDDGQGRAVAREINRSSPDALHVFLLYLYSDRLEAVTPELAVDVLQMACVYGLGRSKLAFECERLLRHSMSAETALDCLCVATQLGREDLASFTREYIVENLVDCCADEDALHDACVDFPELGVDLLRAVATRLRQRGAEGVRVLKRMQTSSTTTAGQVPTKPQRQHVPPSPISGPVV